MLKITKHLKSITSNKQHRKNDVQGYFSKDRLKKTTGVGLFFAIAALSAAAILQVILPVKAYQPDDVFTKEFKNSKGPILSDSNTLIKMINSVRSGLFKPSRRVNFNSAKDTTAQKIFESLKLKGVMPIGGKKVAYIILKDGQMRKCKIGDTVKDMFTVIDIQSKSVTIDILGHKYTLTI